jgi:hypothetical protein
MDPQRKLLLIVVPFYSALILLYPATRWHLAKNGLARYIGAVVVPSVVALSISL